MMLAAPNHFSASSVFLVLHYRQKCAEMQKKATVLHADPIIIQTILNQISGNRDNTGRTSFSIIKHWFTMENIGTFFIQ